MFLIKTEKFHFADYFQFWYISTLKQNHNWAQLKLKFDNLTVVMTEIEKMSDEDQKKDQVSENHENNEYKDEK